VTNKVIKTEYTKKIGFLSRVNMKISSTMQYLKYLEDIKNIDEGILKVRKEVVYQQNYCSKALVIYYMLL